VKNVTQVATKTFDKVTKAISTPGGINQLGNILKGGFQEIKNETEKTVKDVTNTVTKDTNKFLTQVSDIQGLVAGGNETPAQAFKQVVGLATGSLIKNTVSVSSSMQKEKDTVASVSNTEKSIIGEATNETAAAQTAAPTQPAR